MPPSRIHLTGTRLENVSLSASRAERSRRNPNKFGSASEPEASLGLRRRDVALTGSDGCRITVRVELQDIKGEYQLNPPKCAASRRTLSLPGFVANALAAHRERQLARALDWDAGTNPWNLAFTTENGTPLHERNVRRDFHHLLKRAGIDRLRVHDLRHLCASLLVSQGVHPRVIMSILGHSQISLTMNTYSHLLPDSTRAAANALHDMLVGES